MHFELPGVVQFFVHSHAYTLSTRYLRCLAQDAASGSLRDPCECVVFGLPPGPVRVCSPLVVGLSSHHEEEEIQSQKPVGVHTWPPLALQRTCVSAYTHMNAFRVASCGAVCDHLWSGARKCTATQTPYPPATYDVWLKTLHRAPSGTRVSALSL